MTNSIVRYRKAFDSYTTYQLQPPDAPGASAAGDQSHCTELCTLDDGYTYVSIPAEVSLPEQPTQIDVELVGVTPELRDQIKAASPHVQLINQRVQAAIAERYSLADEIKLLRTAPSPEMQAYDAYAEECRAWGRAEKARLGL